MENDDAAFGWVGGALCLDFANTVGNHRSRDPREKLRSFEHLVEWCRQAGILNEEESEEMLHRNAAVPAQGDRVLHVAVDFREALFRTFSEMSQQHQAPKCDLEIINGLLARMPITLRIESRNHNLVCTMTGCALDEARLLGPVAWSAAELLGAPEKLSRVRECAGPNCGWLFLDLTKNHSRRWCDMDDCGSRAKAKRYYRRKCGKELGGG
jgi:predicted RNA-binding Zn ribbon-like protein